MEVANDYSLLILQLYHFIEGLRLPEHCVELQYLCVKNLCIHVRQISE